MAGSDQWRGRAATIPPGPSTTFRLERAGRALDAFVVNHDGPYRASVGRCPHVGPLLDLWPDEFPTDDGRTRICSTSGALDGPLSARGTAGPCVGDRLAARPPALEGETSVGRMA
jgi:hypothetical protein